MHVKPRSYLTAGIAALGVSALALTPVTAIPNQVAAAPQRVVSDLGVELLASTIDPITPWVDTFERAGANIATLFEFYLEKPFPILQTIAANTATYVEELTNGQGGAIPEQIWNNIVTFFEAPWNPGAQLEFSVGPDSTPVKLPAVPPDYISETQVGTGGGNNPEGLYLTLVQILVGQSVETECTVDDDCLVEQVAPLVNFLASPYSGQVVSLLGPVLAPIAVLTRSFTAIGEFFEAGDVTGAINELINIPANLTDGVLNGAGFLDLTGVLAALGFELPFPDAKIGVNLGGLLNAMPKNGSLVDPNNPPTEYSGGIGFDSVALVSDANFPGIPNGWFGSTIGLGQFLGEQLLVTPPSTAAAEPAAAKQAAPLDIPAPALTEAPAEEAAPAEDSAPAVVEVSVEDSAPALVDEVTEVAEDPAPAVEDIAEIEAAVEAVAEVDAAIESVKASAAEPAEAVTPAAEDSGPEAADDDKSDDDTDRSGSKNRRGAN
jgi:hypothetical protein